jgi:hypothetical protein
LALYVNIWIISNAGCFGQEAIVDVRLREILTLGNDHRHDLVQVGEVAVDSRGSIFVTDRFNYAVKKFNSRGMFETEFGMRGKKEGE